MRKKIYAAGGCLLLLVLVIIATASASTGYWKRTGSTYTCAGFNDRVLCNVRYGHYKVLLDQHGDLDVYYGNQPVYRCEFRVYPTKCSVFHP